MWIWEPLELLVCVVNKKKLRTVSSPMVQDSDWWVPHLQLASPWVAISAAVCVEPVLCSGPLSLSAVWLGSAAPRPATRLHSIASLLVTQLDSIAPLFLWLPHILLASVYLSQPCRGRTFPSRLGDAKFPGCL